MLTDIKDVLKHRPSHPVTDIIDLLVNERDARAEIVPLKNCLRDRDKK
jgi:hypothetical protein